MNAFSQGGSIFGGGGGGTPALFSNQAPAGGNLFGGAAQQQQQPGTPSIFGNQGATGFGQNQPKPTVGGGGLFGQSAGVQQQSNTPTPSGGSIFGQAQSNPNAQQTQATGQSLFGSGFGANKSSGFGGQAAQNQPQSANMFGQGQPQAADQQQKAPQFGQPQQPSNLFSGGQPQTSGLFGQGAGQNQPKDNQPQAQSNLFGGASQTGFGSGTQPQTQALFGSGGQPKTQTGFGSGAQPQTPTGFGSGAQPQTQSVLGSGTQPQTQALFGSGTQPQAQTLFGSGTTPQQTGPQPMGFGNKAQGDTATQGGLFGTQQQKKDGEPESSSLFSQIGQPGPQTNKPPAAQAQSSNLLGKPTPGADQGLFQTNATNPTQSQINPAPKTGILGGANIQGGGEEGLFKPQPSQKDKTQANDQASSQIPAFGQQKTLQPKLGGEGLFSTQPKQADQKQTSDTSQASEAPKMKIPTSLTMKAGQSMISPFQEQAQKDKAAQQQQQDSQNKQPSGITLQFGSNAALQQQPATQPSQSQQQQPTQQQQASQPAQKLGGGAGLFISKPDDSKKQEEGKGESDVKLPGGFGQAADDKDKTKGIQQNLFAPEIQKKQGNQEQSKQEEEKGDAPKAGAFSTVDTTQPKPTQPAGGLFSATGQAQQQDNTQQPGSQQQTAAQQQQPGTQQQQQNLPTPNPLDDKIIDSVINSWSDQVRRNEQDFQDQSKQLLEYEKVIFDSLEQIKRIEDASVSLKKNYIQNVQTMNNINQDQMEIYNQLDAIEKELDFLIESETHTFIDVYNDPLSNYDRQMTTKQQIFQKSSIIESNTQEIAKALSSIQNQIKETQKSKTKSKMVLMIEGEPVKIEETLNMYYETLLWLENAAMDLHFQVQEVDERIQQTRNFA